MFPQFVRQQFYSFTSLSLVEQPTMTHQQPTQQQNRTLRLDLLLLCAYNVDIAPHISFDTHDEELDTRGKLNGLGAQRPSQAFLCATI